MDMLRRLSSFALVIFAVACVAAWAAWFNPAAFGAVDAYLPFIALDLPPDPTTGPAVFALGSFLVAYLVYPSGDRDDD